MKTDSCIELIYTDFDVRRCNLLPEPGSDLCAMHAEEEIDNYDSYRDEYTLLDDADEAYDRATWGGYR